MSEGDDKHQTPTHKSDEKPLPTPKREPIMQVFHGSQDTVPRRRAETARVLESKDLGPGRSSDDD